MRIRLLLFMLGAGAIMLLPSAGIAGTCNITPASPAAGALLRGAASVSFTWSGGCGHHAPANTVSVTVNRPAVAGGGTVLLGTVTYPAATISWPTANGSFGDGAGYSLTLTIGGVSAGAEESILDLTVDNTAPVIGAGLRSPAPNANGWNASAVTVDWTCTDALSGVNEAATTLTDTVSDEGANQSATATCVDNAGNVATAAEPGINIDVTAPTMAVSARTPVNDAGWNNTEVEVVWSCQDALSGPVNATESDTVATEGTGQSASATCTDLAGNRTGDTVEDINIDTAAPSIVFASRTPANAGGWNDSAVTVAWDCSDDLSGPEAASVETTAAGEGAGQSASGICTDLAGNAAGDTVEGINIDLTAPEITFVARTPANASGWNAGPVTAEWACTDALSGAEAATVDETVTTDGAGQSASGICADLAGNTASDTVEGVNIDTVAPSIVLASRTPANADGWNNTAVDIEWACDDELSGSVAGSDAATLTAEGANQSANGECADLAGNTASDTVEGVSIDMTAPAAAIAGSAFYLRVLDSTMTITGVDALSGVKSMSVTFANVLGGSQTLEAECVAGCGTAAATFHVDLAALDGAGIFTAQAVATDYAGNTGAPSADMMAVIV
ncbi:MAG TPA: hypothetical protein VM841_07825 [Actinomycetota bacterium]|nr:hypothetical protein [Actinomycetota bacterium]